MGPFTYLPTEYTILKIAISIYDMMISMDFMMINIHR